MVVSISLIILLQDWRLIETAKVISIMEIVEPPFMTIVWDNGSLYKKTLDVVSLNRLLDVMHVLTSCLVLNLMLEQSVLGRSLGRT